MSQGIIKLKENYSGTISFDFSVHPECSDNIKHDKSPREALISDNLSSKPTKNLKKTPGSPDWDINMFLRHASAYYTTFQESSIPIQQPMLIDIMIIYKESTGKWYMQEYTTKRLV